MSVNPELFPVISPVATHTARSQISVIIPTYNRVDYLSNCLNSVLSQALPKEQMQIIVVDDCSSIDKQMDIQRIIEKIGDGRVEFYRNSQNLGNAATFNVGINLAHGEWIHILHDDDWVLPQFYPTMQKVIENHTSQINPSNEVEEIEIGAICCRYVTADCNNNWLGMSQLHLAKAGILPNWLYTVAINNPIAPPAVIVRRKVYEHLGGFYCGFISSNSEDWDMYKRIASFYDWWFEPQVLACYRQHSQSITNQNAKLGLRTADLRTNIEMSYDYLPLDVRDDLTAIAKRNYALLAFKRALNYFEADNFEAGLIEIREGLKTSSEPSVLNLLFKEVLVHDKAEPLREAIAELLIL
jgi:glycosyltransferase involved in cell wall biosynthesis